MPDLYIKNLRHLLTEIGLKINSTEQKIGQDEINGGYKYKDGQSLLILDALWETV